MATTWVDGITPVNATNLNALEDAVNSLNTLVFNTYSDWDEFIAAVRATSNNVFSSCICSDEIVSNLTKGDATSGTYLVLYGRYTPSNNNYISFIMWNASSAGVSCYFGRLTLTAALGSSNPLVAKMNATTI